MNKFNSICLWLTLALALTACRNSGTDETETDNGADREVVPQAIDPGLVQNPGFEYREGTEFLERPWSFTQHATTDSYVYEAENGVLTLTRIGHEPWGQVFQRVNVGDYAGQTLRYSAWLKAHFDDSFEPGFEPTGLAVSVFGRGEGMMAGQRLLFSRDSAIDIEYGHYGWARHDLEFDLPDNATRVEIRIRLTRGGWMKAQYPSLQPLASDPDDIGPQMHDAGNGDVR